MAKRLRRTARAEQDLVEIWHYIAEHNEAAANRLLDQIDAKCRLLAAFPEAGPARDDIAPGLRYIPYRNYLVLYRILPDLIEVVRVVHGRRDLSRLR
jgi:toxin ParE1/3/4